MKKSLISALAILAFAGIFSSCEKAGEQSVMTMEAVEGHATITGKVEFDKGVIAEGDKMNAENIQPVVGQVVTVKVQTNDYAAGANGVQVFKATTDAEGKYKLTIPVTQEGVDAKISVIPFYTTYNGILDLENTFEGKVLVSTPTKTESGIVNEDIRVVNMMMTIEDGEFENTDTQMIKVKGHAKIDNWQRGKESDGTLISDKTVAGYWEVDQIDFGNKEIALGVNYRDIEGDMRSMLVKGVKTNEEGLFIEELKLPKYIDITDVEITAIVEPMRTETFSHKYWKADDATDLKVGKWTEEEVPAVIAVASNGIKDVTLEEQDKLMTRDLGTIYFEAIPAEKDLVHGIGNKIDENSEGDVILHTWGQSLNTAWEGDSFISTIY